MLKRPENRRGERRGGGDGGGTEGTPSLPASGGTGRRDPQGAVRSQGGGRPGLGVRPGGGAWWDQGRQHCSPVQKAQAVPQRRRGRHGASHLPAHAPLPPGPGPRQSSA